MKLHGIDIEVVQKRIKNIYLSVCPPTGSVRVSAPKRMTLEMIRVFVTSKFNWIKKQQEKLSTQAREVAKEYVEHESHYFNGKHYLLKVVEENAPPCVRLSHPHIILQIRPNTPQVKRRVILEAWYCEQLKEQVSTLVSQWEKKMGVSVSQVVIRKMKTRWGSCSPARRSIRINLELAKRPLEHIEYIVVHELVHLLEPSHNKRFKGFMDQFLPQWRVYRDELNNWSSRC
jgi:predicted metal-dependent hydrolase